MKVILFILSSVLISSCSEVESKVIDLRSGEERLEQESTPDVATPDESKTVQKTIENQRENQAEWSYKVVLISDNNWGYQLFQQGTMVINQTSIPSIQGVDGFDSEEKAARTAKYILKKLEKGIFPPTVNKEELDSLGVLRN